MMHHKKSGFSLVLAMGMMLILSLMGLYLLEYMIPFSKNTKGIENASQAFYKSYAAIEDAVLLTYSGGIGYQPSDDILSPTLASDGGYSVISRGAIIPGVGLGNSDIDSDWNRISQVEAISLLVGDDTLAGNDFGIEFRVPDFNGDGSPDSLSSGNELILWQISAVNDSLTTETLWDVPYNRADIFNNNARSVGIALDGSTSYFSSFYNSNCAGGQQCVLKFSVVKPLLSSNGGVIPFIEYRATIDGGDTVPLQSSYISASGKSYGFRKDLEVLLPHASTSSAFDFTVLQ